MKTKKQLREENERLISIIEVQQDTINQLVTKLCTPTTWQPLTSVAGTSASITWVYFDNPVISGATDGI